MGWKFLSGEQASEKTKPNPDRRDLDVVRFIVGPQPDDDKVVRSLAIVTKVATFLRREMEGMSKRELVALEARLHSAIAEVLRSRD